MTRELTIEDLRRWWIELNGRTMELENALEEIKEKYGENTIGFIWEKENA